MIFSHVAATLINKLVQVTEENRRAYIKQEKVAGCENNCNKRINEDGANICFHDPSVIEVVAASEDQAMNEVAK